MKKIAAAGLTALALSCGSALIVGATPTQETYITAKTMWPGSRPRPVTVGARDPKLYTEAQLCAGKMDKTNVGPDLAGRVADAYDTTASYPWPHGVPWVAGHKWDRLIPQNLGGDTSFENVWPMPNGEDAEKNQDEDQLYRMMCNGQITRQQAVQLLFNNWVLS